MKAIVKNVMILVLNALIRDLTFAQNAKEVSTFKSLIVT